ncbi:MAG: hypothetical protein FJ206_07490 [Gemmatimonadetes bacterium]|nr:hypothetical protein [Gemmatimonadota bacterium]
MTQFDTSLPRRRLLALLAGASPLLVAKRRRAREAVDRLDSATIRALARVVLPAALPDAATEAAAAGFERWLAGYRPGAELLHGYGANEIRTTPPSPAPRFEADLVRLDRAAWADHGVGFAALPVAERLRLVEAALQNAPAGWPSIAEAPHVAIALLGHWAESPAGHDAAYQARIDRFGCRPLTAAPERPRPLGGAQ